MIKKDQKLDDYIALHTESEPEYLKQIVRETHLRSIHPRMLSGHVQGRFLKQVVQMINPERVLEIGTFTGYSAICIAEGLSDNAQIDTIEIDEELSDFIEENISLTPFSEKINIYVGDALSIIPGLKKQYGFVFIDGNKRHYLKYYNAVMDILLPGGYIFADNVLWDRHVINPDKSDDPQTLGIKEFNDFVNYDDRVENVLLPLRDGIMMMRKK